MREALKDLAGPRCELYRFLAEFYLGAVTREQVETFLSDDFIGNLEEIFGPEVTAPFQRFLSGGAWDFDALKQEYTHLFIVPSGRYLTPYENVYRGRSIEGGQEVLGLLQGPYTISVKDEYHKAGAEMDKDYKDLPDFIGLEFSFMHFLCERETKAWKANNTDNAMELLCLEKAFIRNHMIRWIPELCAMARSRTKNDFMTGMSLLTEAFLGMEMETLESIEVPAGS
ncbi:MAG: hypothetical protein CO150_10075 [Nitrospirae bacterium CG_4_9_14_3_um_filter_53_35]|nr:MAG: hypothetical protein AUK29_08450 [Nitrospirae bacterium CG2_30_53_67]PIS36193.1 MAG: hypothetical protein COT35_12385 [Nitrospirae bacterium CG08_land_8_20_14_0_20_52_24]PIW84748.1 MAG: hypothetical protein COZ95_08070 [Nitrospirae bacterium CG_4_8_14_3_um_filter_50_41]PIX84885.1 MAG: hypothetical protein COZ32_11265 [Nitrospirae bacterium CG_4_10_14_3_um_filter_53_41]PJA72814.1 MAG: hypothetical protein CO150_10075 [Nitrospirae bacterium CG_4_9_14_3_um_filter_53_35]